MFLLLPSLASSGTDSSGDSATQITVQKPKLTKNPAHLDSVIVLRINEPHGFKLTWCHLYERQPPLD